MLLFIFRISYFCSRVQLVGHKAFIVESGFLVVAHAQFVCHLCRWTLGCRYPPSVTIEQLINEHGSASRTPDYISICASKGKETRKKQTTQPKPKIKARKEVWKMQVNYGKDSIWKKEMKDQTRQWNTRRKTTLEEIKQLQTCWYLYGEAGTTAFPECKGKWHSSEVSKQSRPFSKWRDPEHTWVWQNIKDFPCKFSPCHYSTLPQLQQSMLFSCFPYTCFRISHIQVFCFP